MDQNKHQKQNYRNLASRIAGYLSNRKRPSWLAKILICIFKKKYSIDLSEFIVPENGFKTFNSFFTRKLKDDARIIGDGIISPVDGSVFDFGSVDPDNKIFVKFKYYYIDDLINGEFDNMSSYAVFYLAPSDYHRVHASFDMKIDEISYLPGTLFSVKEKTVYKKDRVYCRNERIVIHGNCEFGKFYFILVGALIVGKVKLCFDSELKTNIRKGLYSKKKYNSAIEIKKAEEVGYFEMGSSVIILLENKCLSSIIKPVKSAIKFGETIV
ncbi:MAG: archaetidylserine decarboxylase [Bacteroidales bacterium]|nr:archaetidylserine decarboxylase [Bacteroidales bacterium]MDD3860277.1 archaetidylserine decarboxylase [Bacteroidales bacterium]